MKPKILIFINRLGYGGAERVVSQLLAYLKDDFEIHLALYTNIVEYHIPENVKIFDMKQSPLENGLLLFLKIPLLAFRLKRYCKLNNIPTIVSFLNRPGYVSGLMRGWFGFKGKIIICERTHQTTIFEDNSWLYKTISTILIKYTFNKADVVLSNSTLMKEDLIQNFGIKVPMAVIYNPIDIEAIQVKSEEAVNYNFEKDIFYFIAVGAFRREKNYLLLLEAFAILKGTKSKLIFIGGGEQQLLLNAQVKKLNLTNEVVFVGFDSNPYKYMKRADCLVSSSSVEGFPNVLLEALACKRAIISTDCKSGPREILAPATNPNVHVKVGYELAEYGILTSVKSADDIAAAMKRIMEDDKLREKYESKAFERAAEFDVSLIMSSFKKLFSA